MFDPHWHLIDLDPITWRHLGPFFEPRQYFSAAQPGEHGLFVLHEQGHVLKVVETGSRAFPPVLPARITDPVALAQELYGQGRWERVHIIDRKHLAWVAREAQATPRRDLTFDAYYHLVYTLLWGKREGYVCVPPRPNHWHGWTYDAIRQHFAQLPARATLGLGVYEADRLFIGLILLCEHGMIRLITTFEGLAWEQPSPGGPTQQTLMALCAALDAQFAPPAAVLLCTTDVFSGWLAAPTDEKMSYLAAAARADTALWYQPPGGQQL